MTYTQTNSKCNCKCNCKCVDIMNDIIYVYDSLVTYHTSAHLTTLYQLKNTTNLSYKLTLKLFFSQTAAALIYRDLYHCECCSNHIHNKPRSRKIINRFSIECRF